MLSFLKVLASIIGLLVASGTSVLVMDMASVRIENYRTNQAVLPSVVELHINVTVSSRAYLFKVVDSNLTLIIKTEDRVLDRDSVIFDLGPGQSKILSFTLDIPLDVYLQFQAGTVDLFTDVNLSLWMGYQDYKLISLTLTSTIPLERR